MEEDNVLPNGLIDFNLQVEKDDDYYEMCFVTFPMSQLDYLKFAREKGFKKPGAQTGFYTFRPPQEYTKIALEFLYRMDTAPDYSKIGDSYTEVKWSDGMVYMLHYHAFETDPFAYMAPDDHA